MRDIVVRVFPADDQKFRATVEAIVGQLASADGARCDAIERALRSAFPSIHVVEQSSLGHLGGGRVLYAYRDGSVVPTPEIAVRLVQRVSEP